MLYMKIVLAGNRLRYICGLIKILERTPPAEARQLNPICFPSRLFFRWEFRAIYVCTLYGHM